MNLYSKYYNEIKINNINYEKLLKEFSKEKNLEKQIKIAQLILKYAVKNNNGLFTSSKLEMFFLNYAKTLQVNIKYIKYEKNSFLHILTEGYSTGGHTRVVERWIKNAPNEQKHSVVILKPNGAVLHQLKNAIKSKNGDYIEFELNAELKDSALKLRELASNYEYIILHTHMDDPTATIAFGTEEFKRPVLLYNHASHLFWIGKSIADIVLEIKKGDPITYNKRNINNTYYLGVPTPEININHYDKKEARKKLKLPIDKKIIVTSGSKNKYICLCHNNYANYIQEIIDKNTFCYVIGVDPKNKIWQKAYKTSKGHIIPMKPIKFNRGYLDYIRSADLYIDSYPIGGGTAMIDAISNGTTSLSLDSIYPQFNYLIKTQSYCKTKEEFINKAKRILYDNEYSKTIYEEQAKSLEENQSIEEWNKRLEKLLATIPKEHRIKDLSEETDNTEPCDLSVLDYYMGKEKFEPSKNKIWSQRDVNIRIKYGYLSKIQQIPILFRIETYKKDIYKTKIFKILGITIYTKTFNNK